MAFRIPGIDLLRPLPLGSVRGTSPVFVVGMPRSGTTLLRLILNAHPTLAVAGESHAFRRTRHYGSLEDPAQLQRFVDDLTPLFALQSPHPDLLEEPVLLAALARTGSYAEALDLVMSAYAEREGKARWGEKTPGHLRQIGLMYEAFPDAQVVHIVRDPRAVIVSIQQTFGRGHFTEAGVYRLARAWRRNITLLDRYDDGSRRYTTVRYEDLVDRPEPALRALCDLLGAGYSPAMLDFHTEAPRYTRRDDDGSVNHAHTMTLRALQADRAERWRAVLAPRHAALVEDAAGEVLGRFGYEPVAEAGDRPGPVRRLLAVGGANAAVVRGRLQSLAGRGVSTAGRVGRSLRSPEGGVQR
jgi:hypothetical protein